ncbi:MAG TPA: hypothetical protein VJ965_06350, partial [Anaerolineales bacterium]|nr:hypothetical protein [Anaerolineales bacterium]
TLTHTGSVFALGLLTLAASSYFLPTDIFPFLELISGLLILILGVGLLAPRLRDWIKKRKTNQHAEILVRRENLENAGGGERLVLNQPITESGPSHSHNLESGGTIPRGPIIGSPLQAITWRSLITLGVSGGLVPCPDAIAILLIAVTINRIGFGLSLIVSFSLGLAVVLIVIGLLIVQGRRLFERLRWFDRVAYIMPIVSALIVIGLGTALTISTVKNLPPKFAGNLTIRFKSPIPSWSEMNVVYVERDADGLYQLFAQKPDGSAFRQLTQTPSGVADFTISPDQTKVFYAAQDPMLSTSLWEYDSETGTHTQLLDCSPDYCNSPVQAPGGEQLIYERLPDPADDNSLGITTLWWLEPSTGETGAVFGDSGLPGVVPAFSASGTWLSYASVYPNIARFYNLTTGESNEMPLSSDLRIQWHPTDELALFVKDVTIDGKTISKVFLFDPAANTSEQLMKQDETFEESLPTWSPDGGTIALVRDDLRTPDEIGNQIWLFDLASRETQPLTTTPDILHRNLSWSADGQALLFQSTDLNNTENPFVVQIYGIKSGEITDVTDSGLEPAWIFGE